MPRSSRRPVRLLAVWMLASATSAASAQERDPEKPVAGAERTTETSLLETGAELLQSQAPPAQLALHLVGFHPMKDDPGNQMEAHHYCHQATEDLAQCALFDGHGEDARLNGIEYIISEQLFEKLPAEEKKYWHPHNYEILSGQLVAPGIPGPVEHRAMAKKINSYGKTWHVWHTGSLGEPGDALPLGEPHLAWSFNRDGEAKPGLVEARDEKLDVDSAEKRRERQDLVANARPQCGVDVLRGKLAGASDELAPGVMPRGEGCPEAK